MNNFFIENLYIVILFPLWSFLLILFGRYFNLIRFKRTVIAITLLATLCGLVFSTAGLIEVINNPTGIFSTSFNFIKIQDYILNFGIYYDKLASVMLFAVCSISFIVQVYSSAYMNHDKSFARFFAYLNLFNFSMCGLVLSENLFQTYVFWELVGVSSYLLIGFWFKKPSASNAAKKAFIMNRIGDFGLLAGIILASYFMYQYSSVTSLATIPFQNIEDVGSYLYSFTNDFTFVALCILLLMGSIAKSAQIPLHTWLADAMEGPTPVSALIHSATMVAAGVYLIARLYPIYSLSDTVMSIISVIGLLTALCCAFIALTQNDIKRILAFSTNSQLGLMFLALGAGAFSGGIFHLITHAYFKSMLFLCSGIIIHVLSNQQDIRFMGGLRKHLPIGAASYLIGCFSISGLLFSGFYSKEMILNQILQHNHYVYAVCFLIVSLLTAFYMFRSYFLVFEGEYRGTLEIHKADTLMNISVLSLAIFTIFLGCTTNLWFEHIFKIGNSLPQQLVEFSPLILSITVGITGFLFAYLFYNTKVKAFKIPVLYNLSFNKLFIDDFYDFLSEKVFYIFSRLCAIFDKYVIDGLIVLSALTTRAIAWVLAKMQTGNFQSYLAYSAIFISIVFAGLMFAYTAIINLGLLSGG